VFYWQASKRRQESKMPQIRKAALTGASVHEAFECYICRKVMAIFGGDPNRCPGCGGVHGKLLAKHHVVGAKARSAGARARGRPTKKK
jgi:hypothetical protein